MTTTTDHETAERSIRELLERTGMPQPDDVEYRERSIVALFNEPKVALVIELDEPDPTADGEPLSLPDGSGSPRPPTSP